MSMLSVNYIWKWAHVYVQVHCERWFCITIWKKKNMSNIPCGMLWYFVGWFPSNSKEFKKKTGCTATCLGLCPWLSRVNDLFRVGLLFFIHFVHSHSKCTRLNWTQQNARFFCTRQMARAIFANFFFALPFSWDQLRGERR